MASQGDPRVLFVMNLVLSGLFSITVVTGLDFIGLATFTWTNVALATIVLMVVTWVVILRGS